MRKLTISVEEEVERWARAWAAQHDTSLSRFVGQILRKRMLEEQGYEAAMNRHLSQPPVHLSGGEPYPGREDLHDRSRLR